MDIPKEMKELATREMAQVNDAYDILTKLRSTPTPSKFEDTQRKPVADAPKRDEQRAGGKTESVPPPKFTP